MHAVWLEGSWYQVRMRSEVHTFTFLSDKRLPACMYMHHTSAWCLQKSEEWVMHGCSHHEGTGNHSWGLYKSNECLQPLNHCLSSPQHFYALLNVWFCLCVCVCACLPICALYIHLWKPGGGNRSSRTVVTALVSCPYVSLLCIRYLIEAVTFRATEMAQSVRLLAKQPDDVSSSLGIHMAERDTQLMRLVL